MKLILHIGAIKTGTTSSQELFAQHRAALFKMGVWYPLSLGKTRHDELFKFAKAQAPVARPHALMRQAPAAQPVTRHHLVKAFEDELLMARTKGAKIAIISHENLQMNLNFVLEVEAIREALAGYFSEFEIALYLRPQVDLAISLASTASLVGLTINSNWFEGHMSNQMFDFDALVSRWEAVFGSQNVKLYSMKRAPLFFHVVWERFASAGYRAPSEKRSNEALKVDAIALNNRLQFSAIHPEIGWDIQLAEAFRAAGKGPRLSLGAEMAQTFQSRFDASNARLCARRDDITDGDLSFAPDNHSSPSNLDILDSGDFDTQTLEAFKDAFRRIAPNRPLPPILHSSGRP